MQALTALAHSWNAPAGMNQTVGSVILRSLTVSGWAVMIAMVIGIPAGYALGMSRWSGRGIMILLVNTAMGFPPVVVGLFVYLALSRSGPLARLDMLFTQSGMIMAQVILATPPVTAVTAAAISGVSRDLRLQLRALGASRFQEGLTILREVRTGVIVSVVAGFGAIISEVGAVSIVGGGIEGETDVMTTAIMAHVRRGENARAIQWGIVLLSIALIVNIALTTIQNTGIRYER